MITDAIRVQVARTENMRSEAVVQELARAKFQVDHVEPAALVPETLTVLFDDPGLSLALRTLRLNAPGALVYPNVIAVVADPDAATLLLGEGPRDLVGTSGVVAAVDAASRNAAPVYLERLRAVVEKDFLPTVLGDVKQLALRRSALLEECYALGRFSSHVERRLEKLSRMRERGLIDALLLSLREARRFLRFAERASIVGRRARWQESATHLAPARARDVRLKDRRAFFEDTLDDMAERGVSELIDPDTLARLTEDAVAGQARAYWFFRDLRMAIEDALDKRIWELESAPLELDLSARLRDYYLLPRAMDLLAPGIVVPRFLGRVLTTLPQPPPEVYSVFCLDARDLRVKPCGEVMEELQQRAA